MPSPRSLAAGHEQKTSFQRDTSPRHRPVCLLASSDRLGLAVLESTSGKTLGFETLRVDFKPVLRRPFAAGITY
jgi:hypothetical protein